MYDLDHMLNGSGSRQHLQHMISEAQQVKFAHDVETDAPAKRKVTAPLRALLAAIINLIAR